jgi:hypothetical protein
LTCNFAKTKKKRKFSRLVAIISPVLPGVVLQHPVVIRANFFLSQAMIFHPLAKDLPPGSTIQLLHPGRILFHLVPGLLFRRRRVPILYRSDLFLMVLYCPYQALYSPFLLTMLLSLIAAVSAITSPASKEAAESSVPKPQALSVWAINI